MKRLRFRTLSATSAMLFAIYLTLGGSIAYAGIQDIKGDVTDPRGVAINNARVTDGLRSSYTGAASRQEGTSSRNPPQALTRSRSPNLGSMPHHRGL